MFFSLCNGLVLPKRSCRPTLSFFPFASRYVPIAQPFPGTRSIISYLEARLGQATQRQANTPTLFVLWGISTIFYLAVTHLRTRKPPQVATSLFLSHYLAARVEFSCGEERQATCVSVPLTPPPPRPSLVAFLPSPPLVCDTQVGEPFSESLRADPKRFNGEEREEVLEGAGQGRQEPANKR